MPKTLGLLIVLFASVGAPIVGSTATVDAETTEVPRLVVTAMRAIPGMVQIADSISDSNPHMVIAYLKPPRGERLELIRYVLVPDEPPKWVSASWEDYRFQLMVVLRGPTHVETRIITSRDGAQISDQSLSLMPRQEPRDPGDPRVLRTRLERIQDRASKLSDLLWRILWAEFDPPRPDGFDLGCTLATNRWGLTNDWVVRELDHELIKARYPTGLDPSEDKNVEQFFGLWQDGDRLIAYATPRRLRTPWSATYGYIIVRDCDVVAILTVITV